MDRGTALFAFGTALVLVEVTVMFFLPDPAKYAMRGLGLGSAVGLAVCIYSGVYARRARRADGGKDAAA